MPSKYFSNHSNGKAVEIDLVANLYHEAIYIQGFEGYYVPNEDLPYDKLFGDDPLKHFTKAYPLDMYIMNGEYGDTNDFFTKFGLEITPDIKLQFTFKEFKTKIPNFYPRPKEGDLIYVPFLRNTGQLFEIKFVNTTKDLNVLARSTPYFYELSITPFKYNDENFDTGIAEIDDVELDNSRFITLNLTSGTGNFIVSEKVYQGSNANSYFAMGEVSNWQAANNTLYLINVTGDFTISNTRIYGMTSNVNYLITTENNRYSNTQFDNDIIHTEVMSFIQSPEDNPFGGLSDYSA